MSSLLTWAESGVDIKVELATSGGLLTGGSRSDARMEPGGLAGGPSGWNFYADPPIHYPWVGPPGAYLYAADVPGEWYQPFGATMTPDGYVDLTTVDRNKTTYIDGIWYWDGIAFGSSPIEDAPIRRYSPLVYTENLVNIDATPTAGLTYSHNPPGTYPGYWYYNGVMFGWGDEEDEPIKATNPAYTVDNSIDAVVMSTSNNTLSIWAREEGLPSVPRADDPRSGIRADHRFRYGATGWTGISPGAKYRINFMSRVIPELGATDYEVTFSARHPGTGNLIMLLEFGHQAQSEWTKNVDTTVVIPSGYTRLQIDIRASYAAVGIPDATQAMPTFPATMWGVQLRDIVLERMDIVPAPTVWRDITCDVRQMTIRYGRGRFTDRFDVSTLGLELLNEDGDYSYREPHWFGLRPGRQVKVTATYQGVTYPLAFHIVDRLSDGYSLDGYVITKMECVDPTSIFANTETPQMRAWVPSSGQRVASILDLLGYASRNIDNGSWVQGPIEASSNSLRDEMGLSADSEGGGLYAERDGSIRYRARSWYTNDPTLTNVTANVMARADTGAAIPADAFGNIMGGAATICPDSLDTDWSMAKVINSVTIGNVPYNMFAINEPVVIRDEQSITDNGPQAYSRTDFVNWSYGDPAFGGNIVRAREIIRNNTRPMLRLNSLTYRPAVNPTAWVWTLKAFLNYMVRVWYQNYKSGWGWSIVTHIQSIEHSITPTEWSVNLSVDQQESYIDAPVIAGNYRWDDANALWDTATWGS